MNITDTQIREVLAGLVAVVQQERECLFDSCKVLAEDAPDSGTEMRRAFYAGFHALLRAQVGVTETEIATDIALMDALVAGGKVAIEELDRRAAELARMQAAGGALA